MEGRRGAPGFGGAALGANENAQRRRGFEGRPRTRGPDRRNLCGENAEIERLFSGSARGYNTVRFTEQLQAILSEQLRR
ncbi:hypothetical protein KOW79_014572 [Hemibagrus wyckioides]|uniref:Uncharacterized protein n=1 Tax=Hemibagrus wyckioides TaxID=337641 RepID=A0A9D3NG00_9TELE|nr:hypothetical protein KOW79_014572 [Hemibagrus wyckioides]